MVVAQPIAWSAKYSALYQWAYGATGITTRWADQDEPRPDYPSFLTSSISPKREGSTRFHVAPTLRGRVTPR